MDFMAGIGKPAGFQWQKLEKMKIRLDSVEEAIQDFKEGRFLIVVDDEEKKPSRISRKADSLSWWMTKTARTKAIW